jgi:predicted kinase
MQAIIFIGLQGSGKSTFYERRFASTHLRISMDLARTRAREKRLIDSCLHSGREFVIDNTNPTVASRAPYIAAAKSAAYRVVGYFFVPDLKASLERNAARSGVAKIPVPGIYRTNKILQPPTFSEGFDELYEVRAEQDEFYVTRVGPNS